MMARMWRVLLMCAIGCAGNRAPSSQPPGAVAEIADMCSPEQSPPGSDRVRDVGLDDYPRFGVDPFREFCTTHDSDPTLEQRMTNMIASAGVAVRHFGVRCAHDVCHVECRTTLVQRCTDELARVTHMLVVMQWFGGARFRDERGVALYRFISEAGRDFFRARNSVLRRIVHRLGNSPAFAQCRQNVVEHGRLLLYFEVPTSGTPTVTTGGELAMTSFADCVSKVLLDIVVEEHVTPPLTNLGHPIAVNI